MEKTNRLSSKTRLNYVVDIFLVVSALLASLSGIYFLFFLPGIYRKGQIPVEAVWSLSDWRLWDIVHTWTGALMIFIAAVHFLLHRKWLVSMTGRYFHELTGKCGCKMNRRSRLNTIIDGIIGISFFLTAASGIYFMYFPNGGRNIGLDTQFLFTRTTWSLMHTWAGVVMILAFIVHLAFHWNWIVKVSGKIFRLPEASVPANRQTSTEPVR